MRCGISADLANFPARPQKPPCGRATVYASGAGNRTTTKDPRRKAGIFHAQSSENGCFSPLCSGADAAGRRPPGAAAGVGISGRVPRRVGRTVRRADALRFGADAGVRGGLLRRRGGRGPAGPPAPRVRGAVAGQSLSALCGGGRRGCAVALAGPVPPCRAGGLRGAGAGSRLLCLRPHGRRGRSPADLRSGCSAGGGAGLRAAAVPARNARRRDAAGRGRGSGSAGQRFAGAALPWRGGLCRRRACPLLPGPAHRRPRVLCCDRGRPLCRRPFPRPGSSRAFLRQCRRGPAGTGPTHRSLRRLRGRVRGRGALRSAARKCLFPATQCRGRAGSDGTSAEGLAGPGAHPRGCCPGGAAPLFGGSYPAGSGGGKPVLTGGDGQRGLRRPAPPVRKLPLGHRQHPRQPLFQLWAAGMLLETGIRRHAGRDERTASHSGTERTSGNQRSARCAVPLHPPGGSLRSGEQVLRALPQPEGGPRPRRSHAHRLNGAVQRRGRCAGGAQRAAWPPRQSGALQIRAGGGLLFEPRHPTAGMRRLAGRPWPDAGGCHPAPHPLCCRRAFGLGAGGRAALPPHL